MPQKHLNLLFPQWQGNTEKSPLHGADELEKIYFASLRQEFPHTPPLSSINVCSNDLLELKNNIKGHAQIKKQFEAVFKLLDSNNPDTIFTLGGGCDAGLPSIVWLNKKYAGDLAVVWLDAHADMNTPETTPSGMFCGMPTAALMGFGDQELIELLPSTLNPRQLLLGGVRTLDAAEASLIKNHGIRLISVKNIEDDPNYLVGALHAMNYKHVYIHLDLDVLDPQSFPNTPFPEPCGLSQKNLLVAIMAMLTSFKTVGMGVFEYAPAGGKKTEWMETIMRLGINL